MTKIKSVAVSPSTGVDSDSGCQDPPGQKAHLGRGQEPAGRETAAAQDEGMNKGRKLKGEMQGDRAIWAWQRGDWECGKETLRKWEN